MAKIPVALGGDGVDYVVWIQRYGMSCTAACVCTVAYLRTRKFLTESFARNLLEMGEKLKPEDPAAKDAVVEWESGGVSVGGLMFTLERFFKVKCDGSVASKATRMARVNPANPAIMVVNRPDGLHAVVVVAPTANHYLILDPAAGAVLLERGDWNEDSYYPWRYFGGALERPDAALLGEVSCLITLS